MFFYTGDPARDHREKLLILALHVAKGEPMHPNTSAAEYLEACQFLANIGVLVPTQALAAGASA